MRKLGLRHVELLHALAYDRRYKLWLTLCSPSGRATFAFVRAPLAAALHATEQLVPWGSEHDHIDWDRELAALREVR